jgi:hypothetical protein
MAGTKTGFTPGPWIPGHLGRTDHSCRCTYVLSEGYMGCIAEIAVGNDLPIGEGGNDSPPEAEAVANMRLVAAAPDLYEALEWYAEQAEGCRRLTPAGDTARRALDRDGGKRARAALAKALGDPTPTAVSTPQTSAGRPGDAA